MQNLRGTRPPRACVNLVWVSGLSNRNISIRFSLSIIGSVYETDPFLLETPDTLVSWWNGLVKRIKTTNGSLKLLYIGPFSPWSLSDYLHTVESFLQHWKMMYRHAHRYMGPTPWCSQGLAIDSGFQRVSLYKEDYSFIVRHLGEFQKPCFQIIKVMFVNISQTFILN